MYLGDVLYDYKGTMPENTSITIKDGTSAILGGAFEYCDGLTSVVIPNSVTRIGDCAFRHCRSLTSLEIPSSVTSLGDEAFTNCYGLTSVTIGNGVASIGNYAFYACHALTSIEIPNSVTGIGDGAFYSCDALTNVTIGTGVKSIGFEAFNFCSALKEVHISDLSAWCKIDFVDNYANPLYYAGNLYLNGNLLTELVIPNDITEIYSYTFSNCSALTSVTIGNNVTRIGSSAFEGCDKISKIEIESAENISIYSNSFNDNVYNNATLYVPKGRKEYYENNYYWSKIKNIEEVAYKVTYIIDGKQYNSIELGAGSPVPTEGPIKEGYTFNGWENLPEIMPTYDITVYGSYTINKYTITYRVDGEFYKSETYEYGAKIPEADMLYKKGYIFSGWYGLPSTMLARNIIVTSSFTLDTTAVDSVEGESRDRIIYDLNGNRINGTETLERGVYIVDGVKVLVR